MRFRPDGCTEEPKLSQAFAAIQRFRRLSRRSPLLRRFLIIANSLLLIGTLAGFLGAHWWAFDLVANLRSQLAIGLLATSVGLALLSLPWFGLAALAGAVLNLVLVLPLVVAAPAPAPMGGDAPSLDVTFFNTKIRADGAAVVEYLRERDDDLIVMAATTPAWVRTMQEADFGLHVVSGSELTPGLEILILARDPGARVAVHRLTPANRDVLVEVVVELDGEPIHVVGTHPVSPLTRQRALRRDLVLEWIGRWPDRREPPVVVLGDLNATPWSTEFQAMIEHGELVDSQRAHGLQPSWPAVAGPFGIPIDHVLHSEELTTVERELGPSFGSDHRMVHARIARRPEAGGSL